MMSEVLGITSSALARFQARQNSPSPNSRIGRPRVMSAQVREQIRQCYLDHHRQWGPSVLACWAQKLGLGSFSPQTVSAAISDLKPTPTVKPKPLRLELTKPGVMWAEDGASFRERGNKRELLVVQDECSRFKPAHRLVNGPATGSDVLAVLKEAKMQSELPLVLKRDGGSIFDEKEVMNFLNKNDVVVITSPPYYPQYNGKKERSFRDIRSYEKALRQSGGTCSLEKRIDESIYDLNYQRPRPVLGGRTSYEVETTSRQPLPSRREFRKRVEKRERTLINQAASRHERDDARRKAVQDVLSWYGFINWTRNVSTNYKPKGKTN